MVEWLYIIQRRLSFYGHNRLFLVCMHVIEIYYGFYIDY